MILNILTFTLVILLPGVCVLWLLNIEWFKKWELQAGGSIWLVVPTSLAISTSLVSIFGWTGYYLHWSFYEVRFVFIGFLILLSLASVIKLWQKRQNFKISISDLRIKNFSYKSWEFVVFVFIVVVLILAIYGGTWFSHTADSFNHMAAVRSLIKYDNPVPMQIHWDIPVTGMDPTFGTWHLTLAIWASLISMDLTTMWLLATIMITPLIIVTFVALAVELTHSKFAAFMAGLLYVIIDLSGDFRVSAQSNRMGQIVFWLIFIYLILAVDSYSKNDNRSGLIFTSFSALFAWSSSAIHLQYGPALFGIAIPTLLILIIFNLKKKYQKGSNQIGTKISSWKAILGVGLVVITAAMVSFAVRSLYTINDRYPIIAQQSQELQQINPILYIIDDMATWFSKGDSFIAIATILSLCLIYFVVKGDSRATIIAVCSILVPSFVILTTLFLGRGGLLFATFDRLVLLTPPFLIIGWTWVMAIVVEPLSGHQYLLQLPKKTLLFFSLLITGISISPIYEQITNPQAGIISLYSPESKYIFRLNVSKEKSLVKTRPDAIQFLETIPDDARIMADERTGYEMMGLTGKLFIRLPSQHTPLQEKNFNDLADQDVIDFTSGLLNNSQMVEILLQQKVSYVYVDHEIHEGPKLWDRLDSLAILDEIGSGENWRVYQFVPDNAEAFVLLDEQIRNTTDFPEKMALYRELEKYYSDHDRYVRVLSRAFPVDPSLVYDFVKEGQNFHLTREAGDAYNFIINLNDARVVSEEKNSVYRTAYIINGEPRGVIFQHPTSQLIYQVNIPQNGQLDFSIALDPAVWEVGKGDGVEFIITLEHGNQNMRIFDEYIDPKNVSKDRRWFDYSINLSAYSGKNVQIIFETRPGLLNNTHFDWASWGEPRIRREVEYDLLKNWQELSIQSVSPENVLQHPLILNGEKRNIMFQHPVSTVTANVHIPSNSELHFGIGLDPEALKFHRSDGIEFNVYIKDLKIGEEKFQVYSRYLNPDDSQFSPTWQDVVLDLSKFAGDDVEIIFETLPGPTNDVNYDWGGWSSPVIVAKTNSVNDIGLGK